MDMMFVETRIFSRDREALLPDDNFRRLEQHLLLYPEAGEIIVGTGGCRKIRWQREGTGKSGGVRVIYYWLSGRGRLYFLLVYPKNRQDNLTAAQKNALRQITDTLEQ